MRVLDLESQRGIGDTHECLYITKLHILELWNALNDLLLISQGTVTFQTLWKVVFNHFVDNISHSSAVPNVIW